MKQFLKVLIAAAALGASAYAQAPARWKSLVMGLWYATIAAGSLTVSKSGKVMTLRVPSSASPSGPSWSCGCAPGTRF